MTLVCRPLAALAVAVSVGALGTGCGLDVAPGTKTAPARKARQPAPLHGEAAKASRAVTRLTRALGDGDVERVCRPNAIFTAAVIREVNLGGVTCESAVEASLASWGPPRTDVVSVSVEPDLATARVRVRGGHVVPVTLLRDRGRWLLSFSDGDDPLGALYG